MKEILFEMVEQDSESTPQPQQTITPRDFVQKRNDYGVQAQQNAHQDLIYS